MRESSLRTGTGVVVDVTRVDAATTDPVADREALRALVADVTGVPDVALERRCPHCGGTDHGRPAVLGASAWVSLARTPGYRVLAVSTTGPIGVDVERVSRVARAPLDAFTEAERAQIERTPAADRRTAELWTAKEAILKADGRGLRVDPRTIETADHRVEHVATGDDDIVLAVVQSAGTASE
jgi:4'-phosphopantetheinyl transferase